MSLFKRFLVSCVNSTTIQPKTRGTVLGLKKKGTKDHIDFHTFGEFRTAMFFQLKKHWLIHYYYYYYYYCCQGLKILKIKNFIRRWTAWGTEAKSCPTFNKYHLLWNLTAQCHIHKSIVLETRLSCSYPVQIFTLFTCAALQMCVAVCWTRLASLLRGCLQTRFQLEWLWNEIATGTRHRHRYLHCNMLYCRAY